MSGPCRVWGALGVRGGGRARRGGQLQALDRGQRRGHAAKRALGGALERGRVGAARRADLDVADADWDAQRVVRAVCVGKADDLQHAVQQADEATVPPAPNSGAGLG